MRPLVYLWRSLVWYRRTNFAVLAGAAIATAVLGGALLTGHSVRASLRQLALDRLGATDHALAARGFFRASLAAEFEPDFRAAPIITLEGAAVHERSGARASRVAIYGIDDRFYAFHGAAARAPEGRAIWLSPALAREFTPQAGDAILLRLEEPSDIPREFLQGRRDQVARTLRFSIIDAISPAALGEFSLSPTQGEIRAVFVSLERLARDLKHDGRANTLLLAGAPATLAVQRLRERFTLDDLGLRFRQLDLERGVALEHASTLLDDRTAELALHTGKTIGLLQRPLFTYLANTIRIGTREIPYSLVTGADPATLAELNADRPLPEVEGTPILLNQWAAADLGAQPGESVELDYFLWSDSGELRTESVSFTLASVIPMRGLAADHDVTPAYPGITDQLSLTGWDPPFPIDLKRVRPRDDEYWRQYRTTPKAWIPLEAARKLWDSRHGSLTSIRYPEHPAKLAAAMRDAIDPLASGFTLVEARQQALAASSGSTDFGEYFLYFSFFVIVSALLLMGLFFRLNVEQRQREAGLLHALGFSQRELRALLLREGSVLAVLGALLGAPLALGYAALVLYGLRTWWSGATNTTLLVLHVDERLLAAGAAGGLAVALFTVWRTVHGWRDLSPRGLLAGPGGSPRRARLRPWMVLALLALALVSLVAAGLKAMPAAAGFFSAGILLLLAFLALAALWLRRPFGQIPPHPGLASTAALAARNTAWRPGRSVLCVALIASACFLLVSLEAFRHGPESDVTRKDSGAGGFTLFAESQAPLIHDPNTESGRETLNLDPLPPLRWTSFRLKPGDDVSCLNLYQPRNPRIIGAPASFLRENRFRFAGSIAASPEPAANPWLLLEAQLDAGVVPAIVDETSMVYVLHKKLGDIVEIEREGASPIRLKLVGALRGSLFQSELIIAEKDFLRLFPGIEGAKVFLIEGDPSVASQLEDALADYAFDAFSTAARLAAYHRVDNTYISTFQALGALGLLLGTLGMAVVLLRNALERRRELALLRATGYAIADVRRLLMLENLALLAAGLLAGTLCAILAVAPAMWQRGLAPPLLSIAALIGMLLLAGAAATLLAVRAALHAPLMESLRSE